MPWLELDGGALYLPDDFIAQVAATIDGRKKRETPMMPSEQVKRLEDRATRLDALLGGLLATLRIPKNRSDIQANPALLDKLWVEVDRVAELYKEFT